jgi:hypothetical protein
MDGHQASHAHATHKNIASLRGRGRMIFIKINAGSLTQPQKAGPNLRDHERSVRVGEKNKGVARDRDSGLSPSPHLRHAVNPPRERRTTQTTQREIHRRLFILCSARSAGVLPVTATDRCAARRICATTPRAPQNAHATPRSTLQQQCARARAGGRNSITRGVRRARCALRILSRSMPMHGRRPLTRFPKEQQTPPQKRPEWTSAKEGPLYERGAMTSPA